MSLFRPGILPAFTLVTAELSSAPLSCSRMGLRPDRTSVRAPHRHQARFLCRLRQQELNNLGETLPLSLTVHIYNTKGVHKISGYETVLLISEHFLKENNTKEDKQVKQITAELL